MRICPKINYLSLFLLVCVAFQSAVLSQTVGENTANQTGRIEIPSKMEYSTYDRNVKSESVLVIEVTADNRTFYRNVALTDANFAGEMARYWDRFVKSPDRNWVYVRGDGDVKFGRLIEIFRNLAKSEVKPNKIRLIVDPLKEIDKNE